ncbi:MAG TPA: M1 family aminopeptidase [Candidatus Krumholzibacteria bacterium]|nr:M1 family aminopeptidase [Candidatus Krumholzibacteria bacterium]
MTSLPDSFMAADNGSHYPHRARPFKRRQIAGHPGHVLLAAGFVLAAVMPSFAGTARPLAPDPLEYVSPSRPFRTLHTALDLDVDLERQQIAGSVTHTIRSLRDGVETIGLNCVQLTIDSVTVDGARATYDYPVKAGQNTSWINGATETVADEQIVIHLPHALARDGEADVRVFYHGAPKIGLYWIPTEKGLPRHRYEVWSQGEGESNRYWIPCYDYPNDKSTFAGRFRVPRGYTAISNGELVEKKDVGDFTEFYWRLDQPQVTYLIMLAVAKYKIYEEKWRNIPLWYVVPPDADDATILRGYGLTGDMMEFFSQEIGIDYPYAKYAQISVQDFIYGGMENTTATVMNMRTLYDEREALTRTEQYLVAHELAHQWFGDMLTCREWSHMWLNEGFATYYANLYKAYHEGDDAFRYQMRDNHLAVIKSDDADPRPMVVDFYNRVDARNNTNVYNRGASVLHMLRFLLGDEMYRETIHQYSERHKFGSVETQDLMRAVKDVTGENLDWFFEQWVFLAGYPKFRVAKDWDAGTGVLHLRVDQTQKVEGLVPVFRVPVDVEISWDGGSRVQRLTIEQASQDFYFAVPSKPKMVIFDKGDWIVKTLDFSKAVDELLYQLDHADYMARLDAVVALGGKGSDARTVPALSGVIDSDAYWGIRREAALALGRVGTPAARDALIGGLGNGEARVRTACAEALGGFLRDPGAADALEKAVNGDRAYGVRVQALTSLVKTRDDRAVRVCVAALKQESDRGSVRVAAMTGLAELGDAASIDRIKPYCTPGTERVERYPAMAAYAKLAHDLKRDTDRRKAAEFLYPALDDWHLRTREAAIDALVSIGAPEAVSALERVASSDPLAEVRARARVAAARITAAEAARTATVADDATVDELQKRVSALENELRQVRKAVKPAPDTSETE